jgi:hypothetical protein
MHDATAAASAAESLPAALRGAATAAHSLQPHLSHVVVVAAADEEQASPPSRQLPESTTEAAIPFGAPVKHRTDGLLLPMSRIPGAVMYRDVACLVTSVPVLVVLLLATIRICESAAPPAAAYIC